MYRPQEDFTLKDTEECQQWLKTFKDNAKLSWYIIYLIFSSLWRNCLCSSCLYMTIDLYDHSSDGAVSKGY